MKKIIDSFNTQKEEKINKPTEKNPRLGYIVSVGMNKSKMKYTGKSLVTIDRLNACRDRAFQR